MIIIRGVIKTSSVYSYQTHSSSGHQQINDGGSGPGVSAQGQL